MKIPETTANVGAYYGNEENGQWQPNGVIIDNGVGGGVVGSGDAGMHRPPVYQGHIRHVPAGYVMAGAYYPPYAAQPPDDFADYMWMENEEEFDKQVLQQLEEEALMEQCIEAMLEDEQRERNARGSSHHDYPTTSNGAPSVSLEEAVSRSTLNPLAAEFVPTRGRQSIDNTTEEKQEIKAEAPPSESPTQDNPSRTDHPNDQKTEVSPETTEDHNTNVLEAPSSPKDPPEVSVADINLKLTKKDTKKQETKKPVQKLEQRKPKLPIVKSETKVAPKKKDVKSVKSELKVEVKSDEVCVDVPKPPSPTPEEPQTGPKPINYAAAAKASKPKPKSTTPPTEKITTKPEKPKIDLKLKQEKKIQPKEKVNTQRKNSTK